PYPANTFAEFQYLYFPAATDPCKEAGNMTYNVEDFDEDFSSTSCYSWLFQVGNTNNISNFNPLTTLEFDAANNEGLDFQNKEKSWVTNCTVNSNRDLVIGSFVCQNLIIKASGTPLKLIGTFIVENIINKGRKVIWYSSWEPEILPFIQNNMLQNNGAGCSNISKQWSDMMNNPLENNRLRNCSPVSLYYPTVTGSENFTWTVVDPERGLSPSTANKDKIKDRHKRFFLNEIYRREVIELR
ncbi:MAG: hypothetical protein HQK53_12090, partial [Oligoflexia bacterium]|nr:hypothetical protein [Oligoflexia bacterium]